MPLTADALKTRKIWNQALKDGELVFAMDQAKTPAQETPGPWGFAAAGHDGYCQGLMIQWLKDRKAGGDFAYDKKTRIFNNPHWHSTKFHNIYMELPTTELTAPSGSTYQVDDRDSLKAGGLTIDAVAGPFPLTAATVRQQMQAHAGLYYISLHGHAVAGQNLHNAPHFFDPNFGHFKFTDFSRFQRWFVTFLQESGYDQDFDAVTLFRVS